jgi:uncharacterized protein (TIGR02453 family)
VDDFDGFPAELFVFFEQLRANNDRAWFSENKPRYYEVVVNPITEFITRMAPRLRGISEHFVADPRPHGGSMFRIYRDTRFSRDKTPYKTHAGIHFRHEAGRNAHAPGFYVHLSPDGISFGGGIWRPAGPELGRIRDHIADNARAWSRISNSPDVGAAGGVRGDSLKRPPRGFDPDHQHIDDLKRKSFFVMVDAPRSAALEPGFPDAVADAFEVAAPLNQFVCGALDLPF